MRNIVPIIAIVSLALLAFGILSSNNSQYQIYSKSGIKETGMVCVKLIKSTGEEVDLGCNHNVLYDDGKELIETILGYTGSGGPVNVISLCNATAGCATPTSAGTETYNEITTCGLNPTSGSYASTGIGNWTITYTFTSSCNGVSTNVTRLKNSGGIKFAGNSFTLATLQSGDQLQIKWYVWVQ